MTDKMTIPVVSFDKFLTGTREDQQDVAAQVYDAFSKVGFIYLKDHGISQGRVDEMFRLVGQGLSWHVLQSVVYLILALVYDIDPTQQVTQLPLKKSLATLRGQRIH
jgi:hypothetical protein